MAFLNSFHQKWLPFHLSIHMSYSYFMCDIFVDEISLVFVVGLVMSTVIIFYGMHIQETYEIVKFYFPSGYYKFGTLKSEIIPSEKGTS